MPKVTTIKCPECAAPLKVTGDATRTTCEYCGSTISLRATQQIPAAGKPKEIRVDQVQAMLEREAQRFHTPRRGAGRSGAKVMVLVGAVVMVAVVGLVVSMTVTRSVNDALDGVGDLVSASGGNWAGHQQWNGRTVPILHDATGDGQPEVFGWMRSPAGQEGLFLVGLDVAHQQNLWDVKVLASTEHEQKVRLAFAGDKLLVADPLGVLTAYAPHNGQVVFKATLGERTERFCAGDEGLVVVELADRRRIGVELATGEAKPLAGKAKPRKPCDYVVTNQPGETATWRLDGRTFIPHPDLPEVDGMEVERMLVDLQGEVDFPLGTKQPGTAVPTAAARERKTGKILWKTAIPAVGPLTVDETEPEQAALADGKLLIPYELSGSRAPFRLACLDAQTGKSLWDVEVPDSGFMQAPGLVVQGGRVYAAVWTTLHVFDLQTGKLQTTIGQWM